MKFLIFTQYYAPESNSPAVRLPALARELTRRGHSVEVVAPMPNHPRERIFPGYRRRFYVRDHVEGVVVHRVWLHAAVGSGIHRLLNYATYASTSLYALFRARRPDYIVVNVPPPTLAVPAIVAARIRRARVILHMGDIWPDVLVDAGLMKDGAMRKLLSSLERWSYRRAEYVNATTADDHDRLRDVKGIEPERLLFFPNGADPDMFQPGSYDGEWASEQRLPGKRVVIFAGTMGYLHGLDTALEAARLLEAAGIHWAFVGGGSDKRRLMQKADAMGIGNVSFHEPVDARGVARYYRVADAGVAVFLDSPGLNRTVSAKVLPCMASGKPIVFSGDGATAKLIRDADAGVVTPARDAPALAEAIRNLVADPDRAAALGSNGRRHIVENLSWRVIVERWLAGLDAANVQRGTGT